MQCMFPNEAAENRIHKTSGGMGLRLFEDTLWIKTGETEQGMDLDGMLVVSQILKMLRMLQFIFIMLCYCYFLLLYLLLDIWDSFENPDL